MREFKTCNGCKIEKSFKDFRKLLPSSPGWKAKDGSQRFSRCLKCEAKNTSLRYRKNPHHQAYYTLKRRAKDKSIKFELSKEDLFNMYENKPDKCPILGIKIKYAGLNADKKIIENSPSVDRIDPKKGYVKGNVMIISNLANRIKQDASIEDIEKVLTFMKRFNKK